IAVDVIFTIASVSYSMRGSSTSSTLTLRLPCHVRAFIIRLSEPTRRVDPGCDAREGRIARLTAAASEVPDGEQAVAVHRRRLDPARLAEPELLEHAPRRDV